MSAMEICAVLPFDPSKCYGGLFRINSDDPAMIEQARQLRQSHMEAVLPEPARGDAKMYELVQGCERFLLWLYDPSWQQP
jgi:hypothetical protein